MPPSRRGVGGNGSKVDEKSNGGGESEGNKITGK